MLHGLPFPASTAAAPRNPACPIFAKKRGPHFLNVFPKERMADALSGAAGHRKKAAFSLSKKNCRAVRKKVRNRQKSQKIIIRILSPHPNDNLSAEKKRARSRKNYSVPVFRNMRLPESGLHYPRVRQVSAPAIRPAASTCRIRFFHRRYSPKTDTPSI